MFCKKCGEILPEGTRRCPVCGASQRKDSTKINSDCDHTHGAGLGKSFQSLKERIETASQPVQKNTYTQSGYRWEKPTVEDVIQALRDFFTRYSDFSGRSSRREFWMVFLCLTVANMLIYVTGGWLLPLWSLALFIPSLALGVRRLHDIGKPGTWMLFALIPFVGSLVLLILFAMDSAPGNRWGPRP